MTLKGIVALCFAACLASCTDKTETAAKAPTSEAAIPAIAAAPVAAYEVCGFKPGSPPPADAKALASKTVLTEAEPRVFFTFEVCDLRQRILVEFAGENVGFLEVEEKGGCVPGLACVGDRYEDVASRFPNAKRFATLIEGKLLGLIVDDHAAIHFDPAGLDDDCFDAAPDACPDRFANRRVIRVAVN